MRNTKLMQLGWIAAAGLAGILMAGGFQGETNKFAVVDVSQMIEKSTFGQATRKTFDDMKTARQGVLEFLEANQVASAEQVKLLMTLSVKDNPTAEDKTNLDKVKKDILAAKDKQYQLMQKAAPTDEERSLMALYADRTTKVQGQLQQLVAEFTNEIQKWADDQKTVSITKARAAIAEVAKTQGFTVVYEANLVPYCANDLTEPALKAMNAKK
jgi:Skp family chaperone for outer membrane proteins